MNLEELLKQAMELEKMQAILYKGLAQKFSFSEEISRFWSEMAEDEKGHYEHIIILRDKLGPKELSVEVDNNLYHRIRKGLDELKISQLEKVLDLHDACELAAIVEDYETIAVFEFIHNQFKQDSYRLEITNIIFAHLDKFTGFCERFSSIDERRNIKALSLP